MANSAIIHKRTLAPEVGRFHIGALTDVEPGHGANTKCQSVEPMCQIMFYNQLPTSATNHKLTLTPEVGHFHIVALTDVKPLHWGGHQVSVHGANV